MLVLESQYKHGAQVLYPASSRRLAGSFPTLSQQLT